MEAEKRRKRDNLKRRQVRRMEDWISKLRVKRNALKRSDRDNLRVTAILNHALGEAKTELKFQRFQLVKTVVPKTGFEACKDTSKDKVSVKTVVPKTGFEVCEDTSKDKVSHLIRDEKIKDVFDSLDNFMSELKKVKTFVQR
jgi:hypothetical protein